MIRIRYAELKITLNMLFSYYFGIHRRTRSVYTKLLVKKLFIYQRTTS